MGAYTGGTSADDLLRLRRMTAEPTEAIYTDAILTSIIERYPVADVDGYWPDDYDWTATYDLALAASEIWSEKSAALAANFDFDADGASFSKSQQVTHAERQARRWHSLRVPGMWTAESVYASSSESIVGNWNDPYE